MHVRKYIQVIFQIIWERLLGSFQKKKLFNKTSTYLSEFRLSYNYVELILRFNIFVWYQPPNLLVNINIKFS